MVTVKILESKLPYDFTRVPSGDHSGWDIMAYNAPRGEYHVAPDSHSRADPASHAEPYVVSYSYGVGILEPRCPLLRIERMAHA